MKKLILIFAVILMASGAFSGLRPDYYLVFAINKSASTAGKIAFRDHLKLILGDETEIRASDLPEYSVVAHPGKTAYLLVVSERNIIARATAIPAGLTLAKINAWKPNVVQAARGPDWDQCRIDLGLGDLIEE